MYSSDRLIIMHTTPPGGRSRGLSFGQTHHHLEISVIHLVLLLALPLAPVSPRDAGRLHLIVRVVVVIVVLVSCGKGDSAREWGIMGEALAIILL